MNGFHLPTEALLGRPLKLRYLLVAWALAAVAVLIQGVAQQTLDHGGVSVEFLLRWRLYPITLWALATPFILAAARRWPVSGAGWPAHVAVHVAVFSAWMLVSNALLRIPDALKTETAGIGGEAVTAAIEYAPGGATLWILLLVVGRGPSTKQGGRDGAAPQAKVRIEPLSLLEGYRTHLVPQDEIRWVEADGDYLRVHTQERSYRIRGTMKGIQRRLDGDRFLRIHRSTVVNLNYVREVQPYFHGDYVAVLRDGTELRVPRSRRAAIRRLRGSSFDG